MQIIDFILNVAAWILWVNGWMQCRNPVKMDRPLTLLSTLKASPPKISVAWFYFGGFLVILLIKTLFLHYLGAPLQTTMSIDFLLFFVYFKTGSFFSMASMAVASFLKIALIAYIWVWFLWHLSRKGIADNLVNSLGDSMGLLKGRHVLIQVSVFLLGGVLGWLGLGLYFSWMGALPSNQETSLLLWQGLWLSLSAWVGLYWLIVAMLSAYLIHSYIYLGPWEGWDWLEGMVERLLSPLKPLPLQWARIDFAPLVALGLNWLIFTALIRLIQYGYQSRPF